jgi:hypothetical protein
LDKAKNYAGVWKIVKETTECALGKRRDSMMLFLDDLPLQLGAYFPVGTNNIVLNRTLVEIVEASLSDKPTVNALIYNLLLHDICMHCGVEAGGQEVVEVAKKCLAKDTLPLRLHVSHRGFAKDIPWTYNGPKRLWNVSDFEKTGKYIV